MYKLRIEQGYNRIVMEFDDANTAADYMAETSKHCKKETTFTLVCIVNENAESEEDE